MKAIFALQDIQARKTNISPKMIENHVNHGIKVIQEITEWFKEQVKVITQQFAYFKAKIIEFTMSG